MDAILTLWFTQVVIPVSLIGIGYILGYERTKKRGCE